MAVMLQKSVFKMNRKTPLGGFLGQSLADWFFDGEGGMLKKMIFFAYLDSQLVSVGKAPSFRTKIFVEADYAGYLEYFSP